jgi:hypothetical protein
MFRGETSWLSTQRTLVAPVTVMFEKLLLLCVRVLAVELPPALRKPVTMPPLAVLLNVPTIALLLTVWFPLTGSASVLRTRFTEPEVFTLRFVNVLSEMVCAAVRPWA